MKKLLLYLITLLFVVVSCSGDDNPKNTLPEATTIGANTAGCIINERLLIPTDGETGWSGTPYGLTTGAGPNFHPPTVGNDYKYIRIVNFEDRPTYSLWLQMDNMLQGEGEYTIGQANGEYFIDGPNNPFIIAQYYDGENLGKTYYSSANSGSITITRFDYPNGIYSGLFNGTLYNKDNPDETLEITDGRFDIKIASLNQ